MLKRGVPFGFLLAGAVLIFGVVNAAYGASEQFNGRIFSVGPLKPIDSQMTLKVGDKAPDFKLPSLSGEDVSLSRFLGSKNVVISFVPAAWTPVCSEQVAGV